MPSDLRAILKLEAPIIVEIGRLTMPLGEVLSFGPGSLIEIDKRPEDELEVLVNNKVIASGFAVKLGERFGVRIAFVGNVRERIRAMGARSSLDVDASDPDAEAEALADKMLDES